MRLRDGLHARFLAAVVVALLVVLGVVALVLHRQDVMRQEVLALSEESMHALAFDRLAERGEAAVVQLAASLVNPLYYFDLDQIGALLRAVMKQPDVAYAVVYDNTGAVIHDGSGDIATFGQVMDDALAYEAIAGTGPHVQSSDSVLDVSTPVRLGDQRLGGLRIGYSVASVAKDEARAVQGMSARLSEIGRRHAGWIAALMAALVVFGGGISFLLQRTLVRPIRQLADAAREIEAGNFAAAIPRDGRRDELGDLMRAFGRMGDSIVRHDREMRRMAYTDALTGLSNRLAFREVLDRRLMELHGASRQLALLFADIDDFKRINDTLGHDAGDEVLVQFSTRIQEAVERHGGAGAHLARFGGDEFVVLIESDALAPGGIRTAASRLAETLVAELSRPILVRGRQVFLGTSIGITLFPDDAVGASMLMKNGDIAMYQAKVAGKNCYRFYSRAMDQAVERRVRMEQDLRGAWERGELSIAYQPVFRLEDTRLVGAEALLRWHHPEHGMVAPSVFIDVAEQSGLIEVIGPQVLRAACQDAVRWRRDFPGQELFVSVNVSARQLRTGDLAGQVERVLEETGLPAGCLHVELTETAVIGDELRVSSLLSRLRTAGVKVWLDDFGTGFSGLSHLRRVPVDGVKIDRSFIADVLRDPDDLALTTAIIAMAHSLGITVVAEGVEKEGQFNVLRERGCDLAQGYWLGYPMTVHDFRRLLA
ncbi:MULTISPECIES: GGDEF domain-containing phosphodiesterase [unclassified Luteimonas]|uniref:putative bifunctional diguanylate cyclase/phosphodiesterase n=1 Tax=unclassified Luteimonas TaxID=2629088 RepID=UPI0018F0DF45|nr:MULTISPECIES: GGDEF domain-containing phosphodiesterase [unclassified Luteimonas]MBJ6980410.1 EAL domain-containing protein [Luteimonas sp. MC1572]MBJ7574321.1 EAL domain-containing protein [Luteimonas sp. MC1828]QQO04292.1 EAL domain-containing protein [Luteimonas sp. MC1572]